MKGGLRLSSLLKYVAAILVAAVIFLLSLYLKIPSEQMDMFFRNIPAVLYSVGATAALVGLCYVMLKKAVRAIKNPDAARPMRAQSQDKLQSIARIAVKQKKRKKPKQKRAIGISAIFYLCPIILFIAALEQDKTKFGGAFWEKYVLIVGGIVVLMINIQVTYFLVKDLLAYRRAESYIWQALCKLNDVSKGRAQLRNWHAINKSIKQLAADRNFFAGFADAEQEHLAFLQDEIKNFCPTDKIQMLAGVEFGLWLERKYKGLSHGAVYALQQIYIAQCCGSGAVATFTEYWA